MSRGDAEDTTSGGAPEEPDVENPQADPGNVDPKAVEDDGTPVENPSGG